MSLDGNIKGKKVIQYRDINFKILTSITTIKFRDF